jgi:hypothetical protein
MTNKMGITHEEFGRWVRVSPSFFSSYPEARALVDDNLKKSFELDKAKHFPTWDGEPKYIQGPDAVDEIPVMKDGSELPENVMTEYLDSYHEGSSTALAFWIRHPECELKEFKYHQFGYYAAVPKEHIVRINK